MDNLSLNTPKKIFLGNFFPSIERRSVFPNIKINAPMPLTIPPKNKKDLKKFHKNI